MAAQLTRTSGLSARPLARGCERATSSLPVPVSPVMSTVESVLATRLMASKTAFMQSLRPSSSSMPRHFADGFAQKLRFLRQQPICRSASSRSSSCAG